MTSTGNRRGSRSARSDAFVFFGATGDLAFKQIFPALAGLIGEGEWNMPIIGVARHGDLAGLRDRAAKSLASAGITDAKLSRRLQRQLRFVRGDLDDPETFRRLRAQLGKARHPLHYLAIPPELFTDVVRMLGESDCAKGARVIVEKPFGRNLAAARRLNAALHAEFDEAAIFRIDHFLAKEQVQNLIYFRFANRFVEPIWSSEHVASVQVTMAEDFGVEDRGEFYDAAGAIRDVVQNHLLQTIGVLAMEPPARIAADALSDAKVRLLDAIQPLRPADVVRGQYAGYRKTRGVAPDSTAETYVALRLAVGAERWNGVPFYVRAGKCLPLTATEVLVELKTAPFELFGERATRHANQIRFQLTPDMSISLRARAKKPGEELVGEDVELYASHQTGAELPPYQRLLGDASTGDALLFARQDTVEAAWRIVDGVLDLPEPPHRYPRGTWGPRAAETLLLQGERWHVPRIGRE